MPRNVRNFWVTLNVDGRESVVATGPQSKDGGFTLTIRMREDGSPLDPVLRITGEALPDGTLRLWSEDDGTFTQVWNNTRRKETTR